MASLKDIFKDAFTGAAIGVSDTQDRKALLDQINRSNAINAALSQSSKALQERDDALELGFDVEIDEFGRRKVKRITPKEQLKIKLNRGMIKAEDLNPSQRLILGAPEKKAKPALFESLEEINRLAIENGNNVKSVKYLRDPETGKVGYTAEFGSDVGLQDQAKRRDSLLDDASKKGIDIPIAEIREMKPSEQIDFIRSKIAQATAAKKTSAQEKREVEEESVSKQINKLVTLFRDAQTEVKSFSSRGGEVGVGGRLSGLGASALTALTGQLPNLSAYNRRADAAATTVAKAAGEVRPTNEDIVRFRKILPSVSLSDVENQTLIDNLDSNVKDWSNSLENKVPQLQTEVQSTKRNGVKPAETILETSKGKFEFIGYDQKTGKKKYKKVA